MTDSRRARARSIMSVSLRQREADLEMLRNKIKIERTRSSRADARLLNDMEASVLEARERGLAAQKSKQVKDEYLRRCRLEVSAARASFEQDVKRHEAVFKTCEADRARRKAEADQRKTIPPFKVVQRPCSAAPSSLFTAEQIRAYESWEVRFADFEGSPDEPRFGVDDVPWPPKSCLVSGIRRGDSEEIKRQRLKQAIPALRPRPFKHPMHNASTLHRPSLTTDAARSIAPDPPYCRRCSGGTPTSFSADTAQSWQRARWSKSWSASARCCGACRWRAHR